MALPKKYRLKSEKDFSLVKEKGRLYSRPLLAMLALKEKGSSFQAGFLISKKIDPRAVERNRLRRKMTAAISSFLSEISWSGKVIFLPRSGLKEKSTNEIKEIIVSLLSQAKIIKLKQ